MPHLEQLTPEDKSEVVKIAARMRDEEIARQAKAQENQAFVDAAQEMDLPEEYLERAAAELQQTRIVHAQQQLKRKRIATVTVASLVLIAGGWRVTHLPSPTATTYVFSAQNWKLDHNSETSASVNFQTVDGRQNSALIKVVKFAPRSIDGSYFVNLNTTPTVNSLAGYKSTSFFVKGNGLPNLRLYLENGPNERWRSPELHVSGDWNKQTIDLSQYDHQIKDNSSGTWHKADPSQAPNEVSNISFKTGTFMNDVNSTGETAVSDLEIK